MVLRRGGITEVVYHFFLTHTKKFLQYLVQGQGVRRHSVKKKSPIRKTNLAE